MARPPVDSRLQNIEKGIIDINKKLEQKSNRSNGCNCSTSNKESNNGKKGESQIDK